MGLLVPSLNVRRSIFRPLLHDRTVDMIGGYQLIRRLGSGPRAEVYLGHAGPELEASGRRNAAIKLFRSDLGRASIDDEIESLTRVGEIHPSGGASGRHLLLLRDIATGADGRPCLILPRLLPTTLARLLAERERFEPGEAVTILVPLSTAIGELHSAGVVHGGIRPGAVLFDEVGAPVLACFGRSSRVRSSPDSTTGQALPRSPAYRVPLENASDSGAFAPATPAQLAEDPRVADDLLRLISIAVSVLARVPEVHTLAPGRELLAWLEGAEPMLLAERMTSELAARLFDFADGVPIDLLESDEPAHDRPVQPVVVPGFVSRSLDSVQTTGGPTKRAPAKGVTTSGVPGQSLSTTETRRGPLGRITARARAGARLVRRPFWIVGALGLAAVVSAVVVLPSTAATDVHARESGASSSPPGNAASTKSLQKTSTKQTSVEQTSAKQTSAKQTSVEKERGKNESDKSIAGDDPVPAAVALLAARERCIATLSVLCLDDVDQADSAALDGDRHVIRSLQEKGTATRERSLASATVELSQRLGDSALMTITPKSGSDASGPDPSDSDDSGSAEDNSKPTSLLLIKSEAGWRIRDLFRS